MSRDTLPVSSKNWLAPHRHEWHSDALMPPFGDTAGPYEPGKPFRVMTSWRLHANLVFHHNTHILSSISSGILTSSIFYCKDISTHRIQVELDEGGEIRMGGPGAQVLLREPLTQSQTEELKAWIYSIGRNVEVSEKFPSVMEFWLKPASFSEEVSDCLFYFSIEDISEYTTESERAELQEQLGYLPPQKVGFSSGCNQEIDHRTLGLLILQLAERYQGIIDMGGAITPPRKPNPARMEKSERCWPAQASARSLLTPGTKR